MPIEIFTVLGCNLAIYLKEKNHFVNRIEMVHGAALPYVRIEAASQAQTAQVSEGRP